MKTFADLQHDVHDQGLCHECGGCVAFCSSMNYGAIEMSPDGPPVYKDQSKCLECGLCYALCPETNELIEETRERLEWSEPMGHVIDVHFARAKDPAIRDKGTDGGVVTALLTYMKDRGLIDSAIVSMQQEPFKRAPAMANTKEDILNAAGSVFHSSPGMVAYGEKYSTYSPSIQYVGDLKTEEDRNVAFVGVADHILAMRKMQTLGIIPSDKIKYYFGLFCAKNFQFGEEEKATLERMGNFTWDQVAKLNLKEKFLITLKDGSVVQLPLEDLDFMARKSCSYCQDYSAEYADISFGGLGAPEGWTVVITRTKEGKDLWMKAHKEVLEEMDFATMKPLRDSALELIKRHSIDKRAKGKANMEAKRKVTETA